jgi:hypothetical protein
MPTSSRTLFLAIFSAIIFTVTLITFGLRKNIEPIFNETGVILQIRDLVKRQDIRSISEFYAQNSLSIWKETPETHNSRPIQAHFYRPLEITIGSLIVLTSHIIHDWPWLPILINSFFLGLAGASLFALAYIFLKDFWLSLASSFFMMFSLPSLNATWQTIGIHAVVPLAINSAVISYFYFKKTLHPVWLTPILLISACGPLYKEYTGIISLMLLLCECFGHKKDWRLITLFSALFCYSLSPAFWLNLIAHHNLTFTSTYLSLRIWERVATLNFKFNLFSHLLFTLPPTIVFLGILSVFANIFNLYRQPLAWKITGTLLAVGSFFFLLTDAPILGTFASAAISSLLILAIAYSSFRIHRIFPVIFIVSWLPCLIVFLNEIYLMYSLGFLTIILLFNIRVFLNNTLSFRRNKLAHGLFAFVLSGLFIGLLDQASNLITVRQLSVKINQLTGGLGKTLADDLRSISAETPVIFLSNNRFSKDLQFSLYKNDRLDLPVNALYSFELDPAYDANLNRLFALLLHAPLSTKIYFLNADNSFNIEGSVIALKEGQSYSLETLAEQRLTVRYPYLDPLKHFMPLRLIAFPGNPDLEMYFQKRQGFFWRETSCKLILYQLLADLRPAAPPDKDRKTE